MRNKKCQDNDLSNLMITDQLPDSWHTARKKGQQAIKTREHKTPKHLPLFTVYLFWLRRAEIHDGVDKRNKSADG